MGAPDSEIAIPSSACGLVGEDATLIQWRSLVRIQPGRPSAFGSSSLPTSTKRNPATRCGVAKSGKAPDS